MWPFSSRADPEKTESQESVADALLRAALNDEGTTKEQAMNVPTFAACVNKIAETISTIPIKLYKREGDEIKEVIGDNRVKILNDDTGDALNGVQFKRALVKDYLTGKGGYAYINREGIHIKSLHYVKENEVSFMFSTDPIFKDYDIMIQGAKYKPHEFLKLLRNTENGRSGTSIIEENAEILSVAYNSLKYEKTLVKTGGNKKGFVKSPKRLTQQAMDALKEAWRKLYQNNTENVVILNEGLDFQEASNTSVEMQLNENKKSNSTEICKLINMPPTMIEGKATETDKIDFVQYCLNPILKEFECSLNRDLLLETEKDSYFFAADTAELTKGDIKSRYEAYEIASKNGFLQIDEIRFKENMPPLGLDFIRFGLQDVFYNPEKKEFYTPNMNQTGGLNQKGSEKIEN